MKDNREFLLPGFKISDLLNRSYIDRKTIYEYVKSKSGFLKGKVMDFGCGIKPYKSLIKCDEYIGVDMKTTGHSNRSKIVDIFYDGHTIPVEDGYFDSAISTQCLEHIFNVSEILGEINRVLKTNGMFLITCPLVWEEHEQPYDFFRYTQYGMKKMLEENGFKVLSMQKSTTYKDALLQLSILDNPNIFKTVLFNIIYLLRNSKNKNKVFNETLGIELFILCKKK